MNSNIRGACLQTAGPHFHRPSGDEVREVLRLAAFTAGQASRALGLGTQGDRTVRRWISEELAIPDACWASLCEIAGLDCIWKSD